MTKCNGTCEVCDCVIPDDHLRQHVDNIDWQKAAIARLRNVNELAIERDHWERLAKTLLDGLSMHHPPDWHVWLAHMASDRWIFYGGEWRKDGMAVSISGAVDYWLRGETPPMPDEVNNE